MKSIKFSSFLEANLRRFKNDELYPLTGEEIKELISEMLEDYILMRALKENTKLPFQKRSSKNKVWKKVKEEIK